jgi:cytochrome oxidase Cu insertion factor (SCO1/SenC/PrrC family)
MNDTTSPGQARGRRTLLLIAALFLVPLIASFVLYYGAGGLGPGGRTNKGDLLDPARPLPSLALPLADGGMTAPDFLRGRWTWAYVGDGRCDERCRQALYLTRQSRLALNKDLDRVQRVLIATSGCCDRTFLPAEHPDLLVVNADDPRAAALLAPFPVYDGVALPGAGRIYLIDPLGNLLMSYGPDAPDKALLQDLKKLLKLSHIG